MFDDEMGAYRKVNTGFDTHTHTHTRIAHQNPVRCAAPHIVVSL